MLDLNGERWIIILRLRCVVSTVIMVYGKQNVAMVPMAVVAEENVWIWGNAMYVGGQAGEARLLFAMPIAVSLRVVL